MYIVLTVLEDTSYWDKHGMKLSLWIREEQDRSEMYCYFNKLPFNYQTDSDHDKERYTMTNTRQRLEQVVALNLTNPRPRVPPTFYFITSQSPGLGYPSAYKKIQTKTMLTARRWRLPSRLVCLSLWLQRQTLRIRPNMVGRRMRRTHCW